MKHWSQYWKSANALSSFAEGEAASGYDADVKAYWESALKDLPEKAVIVDIGTGNGALAVLVNEYSKAQNKNWKIHGVDAAEIDPGHVAASNPELGDKLQGIEFHGETDMTKLPFDDGSVDCIVSQFAFEYAEQKPALKEILRVLKPGGKLLAMSHNKKSVLIKDSSTGFQVLDYILNGTPLFIQADLLARIAYQWLGSQSLESWNESQHGQATTKTTQWIMQNLRDKYSKDEQRVWADDIIGRVARILEQIRSAEGARAALEQLAVQYNLLQGHRMRLEDQLNAAYTEADVKKLVKAAEKSKASASYEAFETAGDKFAWTITVEK